MGGSRAQLAKMEQVGDSQCMNFPTAFILSSMQKISNLEPPILYVFPSFPKPSNTTHTSKGKRPGNKYAKKKKKSLEEQERAKLWAIPKSSLGGVFH